MAQQPTQQTGSEGIEYASTQGTRAQGTQGSQQWGSGQQQPQLQPQQVQQQSQSTMQGQGGQQPQQSGAQGVTLEEVLTDEMRVALHDFVQSATACEWCADQCIDRGPEMAECVRLCRDVADLATLNIQLIARDSIFGPEVAQVFADAAEACAQECARHGERHCQACAEVLSRAVGSTRNMLASFGQQGQSPQANQQFSQGMQSQIQPQQSREPQPQPQPQSSMTQGTQPQFQPQSQLQPPQSMSQQPQPQPQSQPQPQPQGPIEQGYQLQGQPGQQGF